MLTRERETRQTFNLVSVILKKSTVWGNWC
jgi:hypothetical protein